MGFKYNPGERIGPYNTLFLERTEKDKSGIWKGKFLCSWHDENDPHIFETRIYQVGNGQVRSCGCQSSRVKNTTTKYFPGMRIGPYDILFIEETTKGKGGYGSEKRVRRKGKFLCPWHEDEPIYFEATVENIVSGHTSSCGCKCSLGEEKIYRLLKENNFTINRQYIFNDCYSSKYNAKLRFDFYLPDYSCAIEYQGEQHFKYTGGWNNKAAFEHRQKLDEDKRQYCKNNNIKLIEIPYTDLGIIDKQYLLNRILK